MILGGVKPTGLYGWIKSNDGKSTGLFLAFLFAMQIMFAVNLFVPLALFDVDHAPGFNTLGYLARYGWLILIGSVIWFGWQMFLHIESVKKAVGFYFVDNMDEPRLCNILEPLIITMGLPVPFVGVIESDARNAFACGIGRKKAVIVVTRGLIDSLTDDELAAVLAHELSHIKHGDIRLMAAANIFMSRLSLLRQNNALRWTPFHMVLAVAIPAILPIALLGNFLGHLMHRAGLASRLVLASSREFIADAEAAQATKNPAALASALIKVEHHYRVEAARDEDDAMMIAGDTEGDSATHPTVAQRIAALARTTGPMVFNAPGAPNLGLGSGRITEVEAAAMLRSLPASRTMPRVAAQSAENRFGLTMMQMITVVLTVGALIGLHWNQLNNPSAIAAKFDLRPAKMVLADPLSCAYTMPIGGNSSDKCQRDVTWSEVAKYGDQSNTMIGWMIEAGQKNKKDQRVPWVGKTAELEGTFKQVSFSESNQRDWWKPSKALPNWDRTILSVDLDHNGFATIPYGGGYRNPDTTSVFFDVRGNGKKVPTRWIGNGDGFLVRDRNGNGRFDGRDEFVAKPGKPALEVLASLDSNSDGAVDSKDEAWPSLMIWLDGNLNAVFDEGEWRTVAESGLKSFYLKRTPMEATATGGGKITAYSGAYLANSTPDHTIATVMEFQLDYRDMAYAVEDEE